MKTEKTEERLNQNQFELTGKITYVDVKYVGKGTAICRTLMSKKGKNEGEYDTYGVDFIGDIAEKYAEEIKKGDTVNIKGKISIDKWEKDGKKIEKYQLLGFEYSKAVYDENRKCYVVDEKESTKMPWQK